MILILNLAGLNASAQDCSKSGPKNSNDKIKQKVYKAVQTVKAQKPADTTVARLKKGYNELKDAFNNLHEKMSEDLTLFNTREAVCNRYKPELIQLKEKADNYTKEVFATLKTTPPASVGGDDIIQVIEFIWKVGEKLTELKRKAFLKALKWKEWDEI